MSDVTEPTKAIHEAFAEEEVEFEGFVSLFAASIASCVAHMDDDDDAYQRHRVLAGQALPKTHFERKLHWAGWRD